MSRKLAIIPARGGSKRIHRKNIKEFCGKPILAYSIFSAINCGLFDEVIVSTDDLQIEEIARHYGAKTPFTRSMKNSDDFATTADVISEVLQFYDSLGLNFDKCCCIYPTAPLLNSKRLIEAYNHLVDGGYDSVFPVVEYSYPIKRSLKLEKDKIRMIWPEYENVRSQDIESAYHDAGQFYWLEIKEFLEQKKLFTLNSSSIVLTELEVQDIDNLIDWELAELKYKLLYG